MSNFGVRLSEVRQYTGNSDRLVFGLYTDGGRNYGYVFVPQIAQLPGFWTVWEQKIAESHKPKFNPREHFQPLPNFHAMYFTPKLGLSLYIDPWVRQAEQLGFRASSWHKIYSSDRDWGIITPPRSSQKQAVVLLIGGVAFAPSTLHVAPRKNGSIDLIPPKASKKFVKSLRRLNGLTDFEIMGLPEAPVSYRLVFHNKHSCDLAAEQVVSIFKDLDPSISRD